MTTMQPVPGADQASPFDTTAATAVIDSRGLVIGWSSTAEKLFGRSARAVLGRPADEIFQDVEGRAFSLAQPAAALGSIWSDSRTVRRADGTAIGVALQISPLSHGAGGAACVVIAMAADILHNWMTDQSMLQGLFTQSPIALTVYGPDLRVRWINDVLEEQLGLSRRDCIGRYNREFIPRGGILSPEYAGALEDIIAQVLYTGEPVFDVLYGGFTPADPDHQRVWSNSYFRLHQKDGRPLGVCESAFDITNRYESQMRMALLGRASQIGTSLSVERSAEDLAAVAVPDFADHIEVDVAEVFLTGEQPSAVPSPPRRVAERREQAASTPTPRLGLVRTTDTSGPSRLVLPLASRGEVLGSVTLTRIPPRHPFTDQDRTLAEELVSRAAAWIDNARRYSREHATALALQRNLLPHALAEVTAVEAAHRYLPTVGPLGVGGDWYDVIPLSGARVGLVAGDVVGHGLNAAATMGRLRTTVRALGVLDLTPDELLARLDDVVTQARVGFHQGSGDDAEDDLATGATCLYAVYDPVAGTCSVASAGHPAPVMAVPGHDPELLDVLVGPPLGIGGLPFESTEFSMPEGTLLALYTDGLVESRNQDFDAGVARLCGLLENPSLGLDCLCELITAPVAVGLTEDDATLLLVRARALAADSVAHWRIPRDVSEVAHSRELARSQLKHWGLEEASFVTELVVSELVTNAIRYGSDPITLRMLRDDGRTLICEVADGAHTSPYLRRASSDDEGGRGLFLVAQCTDRWGTRYTREGKTIWTEIMLSQHD